MKRDEKLFYCHAVMSIRLIEVDSYHNLGVTGTVVCQTNICVCSCNFEQYPYIFSSFMMVDMKY